MAAGDIILSNGTTITAAEIQQIAAEVKKELAAESKELSQFEEVTSLANVSSLPGIQQSGATMKLVRVALSILKGLDGKNVELSASSTAIQWRNVGDSTWNTLVELSLLKGEKGDKGDKGDTGATGATGPQGETKIPILSAVEATSGSKPSGSFTADGEDTSGNPKYKLSLVLPKGDKGEPPVIEEGTTTTGLPDTEASVEVVPNGQTEQGNPKYLLNFTIPAGKPGKDGEGAGNVYVAETGLVSGKKYLFQPGANNSANGTFVEYTPPKIPEQVQPDWNATEGKGAILNKPTILPEAPKDGKQYARKDGAWEEVEAGDELSKDAIEQALTGNITTHRHDTTYNYTDFETDVWDGTSISTSLQGSGTKDDPYLIQCCADWLHLRNQSSTYNNENGTYFKLNKSLDFNNKPIPESSSSGNVVLIIDGNNATISNFSCNDTGGLLKGVYPCFFFNFNLKGIEITTDVSDGGAGIFCGSYDMYNLMYNVSVKAKYVINGNLSEKATFQALLLSGQSALMLPQIVAELSEYFEAPNNIATEIEVEDNTIKTNGAKLEVLIMNMIYPGEFRGYDSSYSNATDIDQESVNITYEGDTGIAYVIQTASDYSKFYRNSDKSSRIFMMNYDNVLVDTQDMPTKTTSEMQSDAFVDLLNEGLETPLFLKDKDGGTPVLAPKNTTIAYDGYVRKSEFEEFKSKINVNVPTAESPFVDIEFTASYFPEHNSTAELTEEQYDIIHSGLINGKILRIKALCGIFFGTSTLLMGDVGSGSDIDKEQYKESAECFVNIYVGDINELIGETNITNAVQNTLFTVRISNTANESGNHVATFYKMNGEYVSSNEINTIKKLTQSEYDGLSSKDSNTLYVIVD